MKKAFGFVVGIAAALFLAGCPQNDDTPDGGQEGINWETEAGGTVTITNNTEKDMVIFHGQVPGASAVLGGVRAQTEKDFDISGDVDDFDTGGYLTLCGVFRDAYEANRDDPSRAKVEYRAIAVYGTGKKHRGEINPAYTGDFCYRVTNLGAAGLELRRDSPDGEAIAYIPPYIIGLVIYAKTQDPITVFPVYLHYNESTGQMTALAPTSYDESVTAAPRPLAGGDILSFTFSPPVSDG